MIVYHGVSRQDKGIVDAMSGFSVIEPLKKAVVRENFSYNNASNIYEFLMTGSIKIKKALLFTWRITYTKTGEMKKIAV